MERHADQEFKELKQELVHMAGLTEQAIGAAVRALLLRDLGAAEDVIRGDDAINRLEVIVDERCLRMLALYQPEASDLPSLKPLIDIPRLAELVQAMLRHSVDSFVQRDTALARSVCLSDDEVDGLDDQIFRELLTYMMQDHRAITRAVNLILVSRHLERVADHATNIAEDVIYLVEGRHIKHHLGEPASR
jgi:phosphate transport system protein